MTKFIAATSLQLVRNQHYDDIIWGLGTNKTAALKDAKQYGDPGATFDVLPCTDRLAEHVDAHGASSSTRWTRRSDGLADLIVDEEAEVGTLENGSVDDLTAQLIKAGIRFHEKEYGEEETADVLYVQLSSETGWTAAFAPAENHHEMDMTRWSSGQDVSDLFAAIGAKNISAIVDYADDIVGGWDSDWTN